MWTVIIVKTQEWCVTAQQVSRQSKIHLQLLLIRLAVSYKVHMCACMFCNKINVVIIWVILCVPFATKMIEPVCYGVYACYNVHACSTSG